MRDTIINIEIRLKEKIFKNIMKVSGIYKIINKINGKYYVGSSNNISHRWYTHRSYLRKNNHVNEYLQRAWNKYGEYNFEFVIVEEVEYISKNFLLEIENRYLDVAEKEYNSCYNLKFNGWQDKVKSKDKISKKQSFQPKDKVYWSAKEISEKIGIHYTSLSKWRKIGLPHIKCSPKRHLYLLEDVENFILGVIK